MNWSKITTKLEEIRLEELAKQTLFIKSTNHKISGYCFILSFFKMASEGLNTLESWAGHIAQITGQLISPQALQGKLQFRHIEFAESFFKEVLKREIVKSSLRLKCSKLLNHFNNVFVEDSTCITLPKELFEFFPGTVNQLGRSNSARIQLRMELKSGNYTKLELQGFRDNDQKYSPDILAQINKGDLVLRDMGYWVLSVFRKIKQKGAFYLSRYSYGAYIFSTDTGKKIDLFGKLRSLRHQGIQVLDIEALIGKEEQLLVRLVAIRVPQHIEQRRKRKMRKDKMAKRSKDYLEMLGWTIFITNVDEHQWRPQQMLKVYGFRWRIEIVFKCWKSNLGFSEMFQKISMIPSRVYITFYLMLAWLILFFVKPYNFFLSEVYMLKGKILSIFKFAIYAKNNFEKLYDFENINEIVDYLARYCSQTKRKQKSSLENIYLIIPS